LALYANQRNPKASVELGDEDWESLASIAARCGISGEPEELVKRMRAKDRHASQLELMAEVRAYWQVSYKVGPVFALSLHA
jgi:hypothetical protein